MITMIYLTGILFGFSIGLATATLIVTHYELKKNFKDKPDKESWKDYCKKHNIDSKCYLDPRL